MERILPVGQVLSLVVGFIQAGQLDWEPSIAYVWLADY